MTAQRIFASSRFRLIRRLWTTAQGPSVRSSGMVLETLGLCVPEMAFFGKKEIGDPELITRLTGTRS